MRHRFIAAAILCTAAGLATAQPVDGTFTYQGELQDAGVLADGSYDFIFRLFTADAGGFQVGFDSIRAVQVEDGLFTTEVDFGAGAFTPGDKRWLEIEIAPLSSGNYTTLSSRQEVTSAPFSTFAIQAANATSANTANFATDSGTDLQQALDNGNVVEIPLDDFNAGISLRSADSSARISIVDSTGFGGLTLLGSDPVSNGDRWGLVTSADNLSNEFFVTDQVGAGFSTGLEYVGSGGEGDLRVSGATSFFQIDTDDSIVNNRTVLPIGSVFSPEIGDEAGLAEASNAAATSLTPDGVTVDVIDSVTINAPTSGFAVVLGSCEAQINKTGVQNVSVNIGVSASATLIPSNGDLEFSVLGSQPNGVYNFTSTTHNVFPVGPGANTFYLLGDQTSTTDTWTVLDRQLTCIYVPTAYGNAARPAGAVADGGLVTSPRSPASIAAERDASIAADLARIQAENAQMRALIEQMDERMSRWESRDGVRSSR